MACSYCSEDTHTKRACTNLQDDFEVFVATSQLIRSDWVSLLEGHRIGPGTTFRVTNYYDELVRVAALHPVTLFSTWAGRRGLWRERGLAWVEGLVVERLENSDIHGNRTPLPTPQPWSRRFSLQEIVSAGIDPGASTDWSGASCKDLEPSDVAWDVLHGEDWFACSEFSKTADMTALRKKKDRSTVFWPNSRHSYVSAQG